MSNQSIKTEQNYAAWILTVFLFILKLKIFLKTLQILIIASILTLDPFRILIKGDSGSGKTNALLSLINNQLDIDKIYLHAKDSYEAKYQFLITKRENTGLKHLNDPKAFIEYWNDTQDVYKNIEVYGVDKERKMLIVFDMIADVIKIKKINSTVTELFIRRRKLNIYFAFITQSYFKVPEDV